jgi:ribosomal protein S18 acetylase RimI-like enzyme
MFQIKQLQENLSEIQFSKTLYEQSFPLEERRDFYDLIEIKKNNPLELNILYKEDLPVGILNLWDFKDYLYIEHLAIFPQYRNQKIASNILNLLNKTSKLIVLEVELPIDEISTRRIEFYRRNSFSVQPYKYYQPPYRKGEKSIEMHLMANVQKSIAEIKYNEIIDTIRKKVYEKFW